MPIFHCKYDELVDPKSLKYHPKNRNKHPEDQIERLAKILSYQGWRYAIKVSNLSGCVTSGHGRIAAALKMKWDQVPVVYQDYTDSDQEYADVQADNAIASWAELDLSGINLDITDLGPDFDINMLGLKDFTIEPADKYADKDADALPEVKETSIKRGDLFQLGNHRLLCGDATSKEHVERLMNGEKADMVYTDPPYGIKYKSPRNTVPGLAVRTNRDVIKNDDKIFDPTVILNGFNKAILVLWGANYYSSSLPNSGRWLVWDKRDGDAINDNSDCELAWCSIGNSCRLFHHKWNGMIKASERNEKRLHPTQKPVKLHEWALELCSENKTNIVDLYLGSGSTLIACEKTNRKCFGMEIDPHYCQVIIDRWEKFTGQKAVKI